MKPFNCTSCGLCCKTVDRGYPEEWFPKAFVGPGGVCVNLKDNRCSIYATRPLACRINTFWAKNLRLLGLTLEQWHAANYAGCQRLQAENLSV